MSKIALTPDAAGTGVFTIASPATNTDRTLTLPDQSGTVLTGAGPLTVNASAPTQAATIDASGNVLVGKTVTDFGTQGVRLSTVGSVLATSNGNAPAELNRLTSDGTLLGLYKDGATAGSIGTLGNATYFSSVTHALMINGSTVEPANYIGTRVNNTMDIGSGTYRFKDLFLSGGVNFGAAGGTGTPTSNLLDDYEEGTWTPIIRGDGTAGTYELDALTGANYTKIGRQVTVSAFIKLAASITAGGTGNMQIGGVPFTGVWPTRDYPQGAIVFRGINFTAGSLSIQFAGEASGQSNLYFRSSQVNATEILVPISGVSAGDYIGFSITYTAST